MINTCVNLPRSAQCGFQGFGGDCILPAWRRGAASIKLKVPPKKSVSLRFKKSHAAVYFFFHRTKKPGGRTFGRWLIHLATAQSQHGYPLGIQHKSCGKWPV